MKENSKFITRIMMIHVFTYLICGVIFSALFHYDALYQQGNVKYFMWPVGSSSNLIGPAFQIVRGLLFGVILLFLKSVMQQKGGWFKLWIIIAGIGIINTPGPTPCSIEGLIYTQLPLEFHLKAAPEILAQTLLFSYLAVNLDKLNFHGLIKYKLPFMSASAACVMFSLSGVVLALILNLNLMAGMNDIGAYMVMVIAVIIVFLVSMWYLSTTYRFKHFVFLICCYIVLAIIPTIYNFMADSIFASTLTLGINVIPVILIFIMNYKALAKGDCDE